MSYLQEPCSPSGLIGYDFLNPAAERNSDKQPPRMGRQERYARGTCLERRDIQQYLDTSRRAPPRGRINTKWITAVRQDDDAQWLVFEDGWFGGWRQFVPPSKSRLRQRQCDEGFSIDPSSTPPEYFRLRGLPLKIYLDSVGEFAQGLECMSHINGATSLGNNPMLVTTCQGWQILIPAICLLAMIGAPSERVLKVICSPTFDSIRLNKKRSSPDAIVLTAAHPVLRKDFTARELECLAFWLATPGYRRAFQRTYASVQLGNKIELPSIPALISLCANGIADDERIIVNRFVYRKGYDAATWPRTWSKVILEDANGEVRYVAFAEDASKEMKIEKIPRSRKATRSATMNAVDSVALAENTRSAAGAVPRRRLYLVG